MKNHLHEAIDSLNRERWLIDQANSEKQNDVAVGFFKKFSKDAMCFVAQPEVCDGLRIVNELIRLPMPVCWFEICDSSGDCLSGILAREGKNAGGKFDFCMLQRVGPQGAWCLIGAGHADGESWCLLFPANGNENADVVVELLQWLACYLGALNCVNIKRTEFKPKPSKQSVLRAMGRQPLFSTWTLEIDLNRSRNEGIDQGGTHASPRLHLRRGHARQHRPGVWCWVNPHVVGNKALGMVHKEYEAT